MGVGKGSGGGEGGSTAVRLRLNGQTQQNGSFGAAWLQGHGHPMGSETLGLSTRVRGAASSLQMQPEEPVVAGRGPTKTAPLAMLSRRHCVQTHVGWTRWYLGGGQTQRGQQRGQPLEGRQLPLGGIQGAWPLLLGA